MIATFPMYTTSRTRTAYNRFWAAWSEQLRHAGIDAPARLRADHEGGDGWTDPSLLISQTCGYPYMSDLRDTVRLVATPHYNVAGCEGPNYQSWIIANVDSGIETLSDLRGTRAAINGYGSQSGYNSFRAVIAPLASGETFFSEVVVSGGHANSMRMVAEGSTDCAAVDAVSWVQSIDEDPGLAERLKRVGATPMLPGLPFITAGHRSDAEVAILRTTLDLTLASPELADVLAVIRISGASIVPDAAYHVCLDMERAAATANYAVLK